MCKLTSCSYEDDDDEVMGAVCPYNEFWDETDFDDFEDFDDL